MSICKRRSDITKFYNYKCCSQSGHLITILIFVASVGCSQFDQGYFDNMVELFSREVFAEVNAICYGVDNNYSFSDVLAFHNNFIKEGKFADIYLYVFMDIEPEKSETPWGYGSDFGGVSVYDLSTGFIFWRPFDNDPRNLIHNGDIDKWNAINSSIIWHEMLHLYYYELGKSHYCYSMLVHKAYNNRNFWQHYDENLQLVQPDDIFGYMNKKYSFLIHPKPFCGL